MVHPIEPTSEIDALKRYVSCVCRMKFKWTRERRDHRTQKYGERGDWLGGPKTRHGRIQQCAIWLMDDGEVHVYASTKRRTTADFYSDVLSHPDFFKNLKQWINDKFRRPKPKKPLRP